MFKSAHFHKRNLPHIYLPNAAYFITFRIKGSLPAVKIQELLAWKEKQGVPRNKDEKYLLESRFFDRYDTALDNSKRLQYFKNPELAQIVAELIHKYDGKEYFLIAYSIMPNHVHLVILLYDASKTPDKILHTIKRLSAYRINNKIGKKGKFWQSESYDHIVRDEDELRRIVEYTLYNPVKAGLVENWEDWKFNYLSDFNNAP